MTTFATVSAMAGAGIAFGVDVSTDQFATVAYRYATVAGLLDGANQYEPRVINVGNLERGLGSTHGLTASTTSLTFRNEDGALDWMATRSTYETTVYRSQWRLFMVVWDPAAPSTLYQKTLGIFVTMDNPVRRPDSIMVSLTDMALGDACEYSSTPTLRDIQSDLEVDGILTGDEDILLDLDAPLPLAFGQWCSPVLIAKPRKSTTFVSGSQSIGFVVCATLDTSAVEYWNASEFMLCGLRVSRSTWSVKKSAAVLKDGKYWCVTYILLNCVEFTAANQFGGGVLGPSQYEFIADQVGYERPKDECDPIIDQSSSTNQPVWTTDANGNSVLAPGQAGVLLGFKYFWPGYSVANLLTWCENRKSVTGLGVAQLPTYFCNVFPGSSITFETPTVSTEFETLFPFVITPVHAVDIVRDLLTSYSKGSTHITVDDASFDEVKLALPRALVCGTVGASDISSKQGSVYTMLRGALQGALSGICSVCNFDLFTNWDGSFSLVAQTNSFEDLTSTLPTLDETLMGEVEEWIPNQGERWAYFNRTFFDVGNGVPLGPIDNASAIASAGRIFPRVVDASWAAVMGKSEPNNGAIVFSQFQTFFDMTAFTSKVRTVLRFKYPLSGLGYEIGDYINLTWTRGGNLVAYSNTTFRLEAMKLDCLSGNVELTLVWMGDLRTDLPYLLDDETYLRRAVSSGGRTCTVTSGSHTVTFSSGDLDADGVLNGDILVLKDSTLYANNFSRFRGLRIRFTNSATSLDLDVSEGAQDVEFGGVGSFVVADWEILAGNRNYPNASTDPTHYPLGSDVYGRTTDANQDTSTYTPGWKLKAG